MFLELLAAAAATTAATDHPPGWKPADWYKQPSSDQIGAAWPRDALRRGEGGKVLINCGVNIHGLAENCHVISEAPSGRGFGTAAMLLVPDFTFRPATVMGKPVPDEVEIPVNFVGSPGGGEGTAPTNTFTLVTNPTWTAAPTFADLGAAYPKNGGGVGGYSALRCEVDKAGSLRWCDLLREEPPGRGFGRAARTLIGKFRVEVPPDLLVRKRILMVNLPVRLIDPASDEFKTRRLGEPNWLKIVDPTTTQMLFPSGAAEKGLKEGLGVASCAVAADGTLNDCTPGAGKPGGWAFRKRR